MTLDYLAEKYGHRLPVVEAIERLRCGRAGDEARCGGHPGRVVLAEVYVYGKSATTKREFVIRQG